MTTTREYARQYVAEHYDNQLADLHETEYAALSEHDRSAFNALVKSETGRLHAVIVRAQEAWAADADIFELTDEQES